MRHICVLFVLSWVVLFPCSCGMKPSAGDVAAMVDGRKIYRADLEKYFQNTVGSNQPLGQEHDAKN